MTSAAEGDIPEDYLQRIKDARAIRDLTQTQLAELIGVSYATVNRWENGQTKPNNLSWRRILEIERSASGDANLDDSSARSRESLVRSISWTSLETRIAVWAVAEAYRLAYGHLVNPSFASETSLIDPLPHQLLAVYRYMLQQTPLRFLLADDAGAGKTIMTGSLRAGDAGPPADSSCPHRASSGFGRQLGTRDAEPVSHEVSYRRRRGRAVGEPVRGSGKRPGYR